MIQTEENNRLCKPTFFNIRIIKIWFIELKYGND